MQFCRIGQSGSIPRPCARGGGGVDASRQRRSPRNGSFPFAIDFDPRGNRQETGTRGGRREIRKAFRIAPAFWRGPSGLHQGVPAAPGRLADGPWSVFPNSGMDLPDPGPGPSRERFPVLVHEDGDRTLGGGNNGRSPRRDGHGPLHLPQRPPGGTGRLLLGGGHGPGHAASGRMNLVAKE